MKKTVAILLTASMCATLSAGLSSCIPLDRNDTTVTAEEWEQAFEFNVSELGMNVTFYVGMENEQTINWAFNKNTIYFDQFSQKQYIGNIENMYYFYNETKNDGTVLYTREDSTKETFLETKEKILAELRAMPVLEYDLFQYNTQTQVYEAYNFLWQSFTVDCFIGFADNKIAKITFIDKSDESIMQYEFSYDDIEITLPQNVILNRAQWEQAFKFDLPAVNFVATMNMGTEEELSVCWKFNEESLYVEGWGVDETYIIKIDDAYYGYGGQNNNGEMVYTEFNANEASFIEARANVIEALEKFFVDFEYNSFKYNTQTQVYEAENLTMDGETITNVSIKMQDNKVAKISFTYQAGISAQFEFSYDNVEINLPNITE